MQITIDLPTAVFRQLESVAARRGMTLKQVLRSAVERELGVATSKTTRRRIKVPILRSKNPGTLNLTNADIDDTLSHGD
ncbi:MAG: hypothetical protein LAP39_06220 [Acidobacteriia bacterium]|nr:hypothetical protein [Terriglobia bacterium]